MKAFIFEDVNQVSNRYHPEGGLVIIAKDTYHVEELIKDYDYIEIEKEDWEKVVVYELAGHVEPKVFLFPDAGCC